MRVVSISVVAVVLLSQVASAQEYDRYQEEQNYRRVINQGRPSSQVREMSASPRWYPDEPETQRWAVSIMAGGVIPRDSDEDTVGTVGFRVAYKVFSWLSLGIETSYMSWDQKVDGVKLGKQFGVPVLGDVIISIPTGGKVTPYLIGGIGGVYWDFEESSALERIGGSINSDVSLAYKAGVGLEAQVTEQTAVFIEGSYLWSDWTAEVQTPWISPTSTTETSNMDLWQAVAGATYKF